MAEGKTAFDIDDFKDQTELFTALENLRQACMEVAVIMDANAGVVQAKVGGYDKATRGGFGWKRRVARVVNPLKRAADHLLDAAAEMRRCADQFRKEYLDDLIPQKDNGFTIKRPGDN